MKVYFRVERCMKMTSHLVGKPVHLTVVFYFFVNCFQDQILCHFDIDNCKMTTSEISLTEHEDLDENFYLGKGSFNLPNGDTYNGEYVAHRNGLVWREGNILLSIFQSFVKDKLVGH